MKKKNSENSIKSVLILTIIVFCIVAAIWLLFSIMPEQEIRISHIEHEDINLTFLINNESGSYKYNLTFSNTNENTIVLKNWIVLTFHLENSTGDVYQWSIGRYDTDHEIQSDVIFEAGGYKCVSEDLSSDKFDYSDVPADSYNLSVTCHIIDADKNEHEYTTETFSITLPPTK